MQDIMSDASLSRIGQASSYRDSTNHPSWRKLRLQAIGYRWWPGCGSHIGSYVLALQNRIMSKKLFYRKPCLCCMIRVRTIVSAPIAPPLQPAIIELSLARIHYRSSFRQRRMPETLVHQGLAAD